jgi:hypothetical protein
MLLWLWRHAYPTMDMHIQDGGMHISILFEMKYNIFYIYQER